MRGNPVIQWLLFSVVWLLLLIPVIRVTRHAVSATVSSAGERTEHQAVWLSLQFSSTPRSFSIRQGDEVIWTDTEPADRFVERMLPMAMDTFGLEITLVADLPDSESAVEVAVEPDGLNRRTRTLWVSGLVEESISFFWGKNE